MEFRVFFNELSAFDSLVLLDESSIKRSLIDFIKCLIKFSDFSNKINVLFFGELSQLTVSGYSLAGLLNKSDSREYWDRLRSSFINANFHYADTIEQIEGCQYVSIGEYSGRGVLMALLNDTLTISLNFNEAYCNNELKGVHYILDNDSSCDVSINNICSIDHISFHSEKIENFGSIGSASATIHENENYIIQMYINDHNPPHVHVYSSGKRSQILARVNIRNFDLMDGSEKIQPIRRELMKWIEENQSFLLSNWEICCSGKYPRKIE